MSAAYKPPYALHDSSSSLDRLFASSKGAWIAAGIALLYLLYTFLAPSAFAELLWNALVLITPARLVIAVDRKKNPTMYDGTAASQSDGDTHAVKSEALRRVFGLDSGPAAVLPGVSSLRRASWLGGLTARSDAPPGLGNWDNSCYQNSVLQGLSALQSLTTYLENSDATKSQDTSTTAGSLREIMANLNDVSNNGRRIWTPAKLKSMSSWQQQDAQEYFSKIMDDMDKETAKAFKATPTTAGLQEIGSLDTVKTSGLKCDNVSENRQGSLPLPTTEVENKCNPLDGYLAQRVACTSCGFSEGLSMITFNCLTVPLGRDYRYRIEDCLNEYASLEEISGVDCARCTLLRTETQLQQMTADSTAVSDPSVSSTVFLPPELRTMVVQRLQAVQQALEEGDVSDDTLNKKCQIPKKARVSSTKTRQAVIARPPRCLVIHINRSVFDEYTGEQRKNTAQVTYPKVLDLGPWCLGSAQNGDGQEEWRMDPTKSMIGPSGASNSTRGMRYVLRAAVTHYGRHENGHYICYREHPEHLQASEEDEASAKPQPAKWWRLSDDDVSAVTEEQVLDQGGAFMLFYECMDRPSPEPGSDSMQDGQSVEPASIRTTAEPTQEVETEKAEAVDSIEDDVPKPDLVPKSEVDNVPKAPEAEVRRVPTLQTMRTAGNKSKRGKGGLSSTFRAVAAT